ncbi:MAG: MFS transporter [Promethearchaeota archaeon]|nr:MAG: MFS transporter [Candidatus Lokiarchaeota archaeon]
MNEQTDVPVILHSKLNMVSFGVGSTIRNVIEQALVFMLYFYYVAEVGLDIFLVGLGLVIYAIWDAINDPIVGYITDRPYSFTKKWGRRFPWILIFFIPMLISFLLIFNPPSVSPKEQPLILFGWLVFTTCLFDTFESFWTINYFGLFPDKFRDTNERITAAGIGVYIGFIGVMLGFILPPAIVTFGDLESYIIMSWFIVIFSIVCWLLFLPGVKDDKELVVYYLEHYEKVKKDSLIKVLKESIKQKNFSIFLIMYLGYNLILTIMTASLPFAVRYILKQPAGFAIYLVLCMMGGGLIGCIIWMKITRKSGNNRKTILISGSIMSVSAMIISIVGTSPIGFMILLFILGLGLGGFWAMVQPTLADVVDESIIETGKRREGILGAFRFFMGNVAKVIMALTLATVHIFTGFVEGSEKQPPLALIGIQLHMGLIPGLMMAIGLLLFWKYYDITPEKVKMIKQKLLELKI